jgi:altronate hydrolase
VGHAYPSVDNPASNAVCRNTANPTLGVAADLFVAAGGRVILGETPENYQE